MARIPRLLLRSEAATYHVVSRSALQGFVLGDTEKELLLKLLQRLAAVYFAEVFGFCLMGNHFHLLVRMSPGDALPDDEIRRRFLLYYGPDTDRILADGQIPFYRQKWASLSEFVKELKQTFSRLYNKSQGRKGFFWSERFKSVVVDSGDTLVNCLAYIDLNPVRAGLVKRPEDYRWCSLAYHLQTRNRGGFLSLDFGLKGFAESSDKERLRHYRSYVYRIGSEPSAKGAQIDPKIAAKEEWAKYQLSAADRLLCRTRYFTDSGVIGTQEFVSRCYRLFESHFACRREKRPKPISGLDGVYSLKRLSEPA